MANSIIIEGKIKEYRKKITVSGDKSLSIRWVLLSSLASGSREQKIYSFQKMFWQLLKLLKDWV